jgi:hypothetical protein
MEKSIRFFTHLLVAGFLLAGVIATPALAQDKAKDMKAAPAAKAEKGAAKVTVVMENDKVRVFEVLFKPGDENKAVPSASSRVIRAFKGGTLQRMYADGKTQKVEWKTGETRFVEGEKVAFTTKNIGKSEVHLYIVVLK